MRPSPWLWIFAAPALILYAVFFVGPSVLAFQYSVTDWDGLSPTFNYVGLENYQELITGDTVFHTAVGNNLKLMLTVVVLQTIVSLLLALALVRNSRSAVMLRAIYFLPTIISSVSVAFIWQFVYDPNAGLLNRALDLVGLGGVAQDWLGNATIAIYMVGITMVWFHAGLMMVIFIAGLQAIPKDMTEAASIDGAGRFKGFRFITWPLLAPAAAIVIAYTTIQSFKAFDLVFAMTQGGPNYSTEIIATLIFNTAFVSNRFGYAAAMSVFFMILVAAMTFAQNRLLRANRHM
jgi:raffinose/stachyose/melibiose transport system permease protein